MSRFSFNLYMISAMMVMLFCTVPLYGEVYLKGPRIGFSGKGKGMPDRPFADLVNQKELMQEKVICNGVPTEVRISLISGSLADLLQELRMRYPELKIKVDRGGIRFSIPLGKKYRELVLLVEADGRITSFVMRLPVPMKSRPEWPQGLPQPPGATLDEVIQFSRRGSVYAAFSGAEPGALSRMDMALAGYGFTSVTQEAVQAGGRGDLFMNAEKKQMLHLSIGEDGTGTLFLFPLGKAGQIKP